MDDGKQFKEFYFHAYPNQRIELSQPFVQEFIRIVVRHCVRWSSNLEKDERRKFKFWIFDCEFHLIVNKSQACEWIKEFNVDM